MRKVKKQWFAVIMVIMMVVTYLTNGSTLVYAATNSESATQDSSVTAGAADVPSEAINPSELVTSTDTPDHLNLDPIVDREVTDNDILSTATTPLMAEGSSSSTVDYLGTVASMNYSYNYNLWNTTTDSTLRAIYNGIEAELNKVHTDGKDYTVNNSQFMIYVDLSTITSTMITIDQANEIMEALRSDHPEWYWMIPAIGHPANTTTFNKLYFYGYDKYSTAAARQEIESRIISKLNEYKVATLNATTTYDKEKIVHDKIIQEMVYMYESEGAYNAHNIVGALVDGKGVCESYAKACQIIFNYLGIENVYVTGSNVNPANSGHAWNQVKIGGDWYDFDTTWDDLKDTTSPDYKGIVYTYFNRPENVFKHISTYGGEFNADFQINSCTKEDYNYFNQDKSACFLSGNTASDISNLLTNVANKTSSLPMEEGRYKVRIGFGYGLSDSNLVNQSSSTLKYLTYGGYAGDRYYYYENATKYSLSATYINSGGTLYYSLANYNGGSINAWPSNASYTGCSTSHNFFYIDLKPGYEVSSITYKVETGSDQTVPLSNLTATSILNLYKCTLPLAPTANSNVSVTVNFKTILVPTVSVSSTPGTAEYGTQLPINVTVTGTDSTPTGIVEFYKNSVSTDNKLGEATLSSGKAIFDINNSSVRLDAGTYNIIAIYSGDTIYKTGIQSSTSVIINKKVLLYNVSGSSKYYGQSNPSFSGYYSGFAYDETSTVLNGTPSLSTVANANSIVGIYEITADVSGITATNYMVTANKGSLMINKAVPQVTLSGPDSVSVNNPISFTLNLSNPYVSSLTNGMPSGSQIKLYTSSGEVDSEVDSASYIVSGSNGIYTITYSGAFDSTTTFKVGITGADNYADSKSNAITVSVANNSTTTQLSVSNSTPTYGDTITLTAKITMSDTNAPVNEGTVTFKSADVVLGTYNLSNGIASHVINTGTYSSVGENKITAEYSGSSSKAISSGNAIFTIAKKVLTYNGNLALEERNYNGATQVTVLGAPSYTGMLDNDTGILYNWAKAVNYSDASAGSKSLELTISMGDWAKKDCYTLANNGKITLHGIINKVTPTISVSPLSTEYTGSKISITNVLVKGINNENLDTTGALKFTYTGTSTTNYATSENAPVNVGTYSVIVSYSGNTNYNADSITTNITIKKSTNVSKPSAPKLNSRTTSSITLEPGDANSSLILEYRCGNGAWQDSNVFTKLTEGTSYTLYARVKATDNCNASSSSEGVTIETLKTEPTGGDTGTTPGGGTGTVPGGGTGTIPGGGTGTTPGNDTGTIPGGGTGPIPGGGAVIIPGGGSGTIPGGDTGSEVNNGSTEEDTKDTPIVTTKKTEDGTTITTSKTIKTGDDGKTTEVSQITTDKDNLTITKTVEKNPDGTVVSSKTVMTIDGTSLSGKISVSENLINSITEDNNKSDLLINITSGSGTNKNNYDVIIASDNLQKITDDLNLSLKTLTPKDASTSDKKLGTSISNVVKTSKTSESKVEVVSFSDNKALNMGVTVTFSADKMKDVSAGDKVYAYRYNSKTGKLEEVANNVLLVSSDNTITMSTLYGGSFVVSSDKLSGSKVTKLIDKVSVSLNNSIKKGSKQTLSVKLPNEINKVTKFNSGSDPLGKEEGIVTYSISNKKIATINNSGKFTAKAAGTVYVSVTIKLENGEKKTIKLKVTVKK